MILEKQSFFELVHWPQPFPSILITFAFILLLSPYLSGSDFGLFKIPLFSDGAKKWLRIIGPIAFLLSALAFVPLIPKSNPPNPIPSSPTPTPSAALSPQPSESPSASPTPSPTSQATPTPPTATVNLVIDGFSVEDFPKSDGHWFICLIADAGNSKGNFADGPFVGVPMSSSKKIRLTGLHYGQNVSVTMRVRMNNAGDGFCEPSHKRDQIDIKVSHRNSTEVRRDELRYRLSWHVE